MRHSEWLTLLAGKHILVLSNKNCAPNFKSYYFPPLEHSLFGAREVFSLESALAALTTPAMSARQVTGRCAGQDPVLLCSSCSNSDIAAFPRSRLDTVTL